jgi:hypothetical protein
MKNLIIFSFLLFYIPVYSYGQTNSTAKRPAIIRQLQQYENTEGQVQIIEDKRIDDLLNKCIDNNAIKKAIPGFRIRIFSQNNRDAGRKNAYDIIQKFMSNFPATEADVQYEPPDWKVYVGYFRTLTDAFRLKKQIENLFPNAFIVQTNIEYTKL